MSKEWLADIAWSTLADNVSYVETGTYDVYVTPLNPNEPGAGRETKDIGDYLVDYSGYIYEITATGIEGDDHIIRVEDLLGREKEGPYPNQTAYVYRPKFNAIVLSQAQIRRLGDTARDNINNIEKSIIWKHRGVSLYDGYRSYDNVTRIELGEGLVYGETGVSTGSWQGGIASYISVDIESLIGNTGSFTAGQLTNGQITLSHTKNTDIPDIVLYKSGGTKISEGNFDVDSEGSTGHVVLSFNYPLSPNEEVKYRLKK